ncbi:MAG: adaptor protein MecA [Clostridia bacterium]|nr:adaptor protein MecA [Clostridia bacterium]
MKYININQSKMKIILSTEELSAYGIDGALDIPDTPQYRRAYRKILEIAERECGFSVNGEKILIQLYPQDAGGELLVTRLGNISPIAERSLATSNSVALISTRKEIYSFATLDALICVSHALGALCSDVEGEVFCSDIGECYLVVDEGICDGIGAPLSEYGTRVAHTAYPYIREHMKSLKTDRPLSVLSEL